MTQLGEMNNCLQDKARLNKREVELQSLGRNRKYVLSGKQQIPTHVKKNLATGKCSEFKVPSCSGVLRTVINTLLQVSYDDDNLSKINDTIVGLRLPF